MLIFGRPSLARQDVPMLAYAWVNGNLMPEEIVVSPNHPGNHRTIVVRSGAGSLREWKRERRNVVEDFVKAFGVQPPSEVAVLVLWTDSDQTREEVEAYYGGIMALPR
jgi:hypothetical protein